MATRKEVYDAIDTERDYQDKGLGNAETDRPGILPVGEGILLLEEYANKARVAWSGPHPSGREEALRIIRKVAAIAVRTLEDHGVEKRK
jgi:hypothetical protein